MASEALKKVVELPIDDILPNRYQPRIKFDGDSIYELSESIKAHGVFQPILVRPIGDKYEIIAGERRYKASVLAGRTTIPAIIMSLNDKDTVEIALLENVQRSSLTPIEEAISYKKILDMGYITQEDLAHKLGKNQSTIANKLRLLNLDESVQEALLETKISERHARSLLRIKSLDDQKVMLKRIINERLTVRRTDEEIEKMLNNNENINDKDLIIELDEQIPSKKEEKEEIPVVQEVDEIVEPTNVESSLFGFTPENIDINVSKGANESTVISSEPIDIIENIEIPTTNFEKMEKESKTLYEEKPLADMTNLLKPENQLNTSDEEENPASILKPGKFFNFMPEVEEKTTKSEKIKQEPKKEGPTGFDSFFTNQGKTDSSEDEILIPEMKKEVDVVAATVPEEKIVIPNVDVAPEELTPIMPNIGNVNAEPKNIKTAINIIRNAVRDLENLGFEVDVDEIDLESMYQLIIKIDK